MGFQDHQGGWGSQVFLVLKSLFCFLGPLELVMFFEKFEERKPPNTES
jgi:hypothetical protein